MSCKHDCEKPPVFPVEVYNRPALDKINYRIGDYCSIREHLLDLLDKSGVLSGWTHRFPDDPGVALLEAAAEVGDVLTFYQTLYANEKFLRTAAWRESVGALVRLTGYRLAPAIGGEAVFAVAVDGDEPVTVPQGFGFKAQLDGLNAVSEFESTAAVTAYPALSRFHLYTPREPRESIPAGTTTLELHAVDGATDIASRSAVDFSPGDRVMLIPDTAIYDALGGSYSSSDEQPRPEILIVKEAETVLDRIVLTFEGGTIIERPDTVVAYKVDRTFRHFGNLAPRTIGTVDETTGLYSTDPTNFDRMIGDDYAPSGSDADHYSPLLRTELPLDTEVDDLASGNVVICEGWTVFDGISEAVSFTVVKTIEDSRADTLVWGSMNASTTVLTVDAKLIANDSILNETADVRRIRILEVVSPKLTLRGPTQWPTGDFGDGRLDFHGTYDEARSLAGRDLLLVGGDGSLQDLNVATSREEVSLADRDETHTWLWPVTLDQWPAFLRENLGESEPQVTVYGNLVETNEGKTEDEVTVGNGDNRELFQTFAVPKAPLTYLLQEQAVPAEVPELEVYVGAILWKRIDSLFDRGADEQIYIVREDEDGNSYIQFGDGINGSRLPSGIGNVVARYRSGSGSSGSLESGATPSASGKLTELTEVFLPGVVVGGGAREETDGAREAAPGRMQSLDRLVSLADYEAEGLALPGVLKTKAYWGVQDGSPLLRLAVLTDGGDDESTAKVTETMQTYNRCRGAARFPVVAETGLRQYVYAELRVGYEPSRIPDDVETAILIALGVVGEEDNGVESRDGLFSLERRAFGEAAHASQVLAAVQQVEGVVWVEATALQRLDLGVSPETDPGELATPPTPARDPLLLCEPERLLALYTGHLVMNLSADEQAQECDT